ncbi:MAG: prepilin-type N-terminal cleavage/methylation domain-containing protein [Gammaproteobacteria bacterium]|nr:prepilin-type N-terminal cleavage/methylation domain-containing protein [Gammaproteobacteria bacterium]
MRGQQGFTMVEALAAVTLVLVGLTAAAIALVQVLRLETEAAAITRATRLARDLAEELRALPRPDGQVPGSIDGSDPQLACGTDPAACAAEDSVATARAAWLTRLHSELGPDADATLNIAAADPASVELTIWRHAEAAPVALVVAP